MRARGPPRRRAPPGPREAELRGFLRVHRRLLPPTLRRSLAWGLIAFAGYAAVLAILAVESPAVAWTLAGCFVLVVAGGREPAMLLAYQELGEGAMPWLASIAVLGDVAVVLVGVPFYWWAFERLREVPVFRAFLLGVEKKALQHRRVVQRWGPPALVGFVAIPAWGTGPLVAGAVGLIARLRPGRLLVTLVVAVVVVNLGWAFLLAGAHAALPSGGVWRLLPVALLVIVFVAALVSSARGARDPEVVLLVERPELVHPGRFEALRALGLRHEDGLLSVDRRHLQLQLGIPRMSSMHCRAIAELLLLDRVQPREAVALTRVGVYSIRDLSVAPPELVLAALRERGGAESDAVGWAARAAEWQARAQAFGEGEGAPSASTA